MMGLRSVWSEVKSSRCLPFRRRDEITLDEIIQRYREPYVRLTRRETLQISSVYQGLRTNVEVFPTTVSFYSALAQRENFWSHKLIGVPVIVSRSSPENKCYIYVAEYGSGLPLWRGTLSPESKYERKSDCFYVLKLYPNCNTLVGFNFSSEWAGQDTVGIMSHVLETISCDVPKPKIKRSISKDDISRPIFYKHVSSMVESDRNLYWSWRGLSLLSSSSF